jgi:hypothetical protein
VEVADHFPEECRYVLETPGGVYRYDGLANRIPDWAKPSLTC